MVQLYCYVCCPLLCVIVIVVIIIVDIVVAIIIFPCREQKLSFATLRDVTPLTENLAS